MRHLLSHVWPLRRSGAWIRHLDMLNDRWDQFDGRKVICVVSSPDAEPARVVRGMVPDSVEVISEVNDPSLREVKTFVPLMSKVCDLPGYTFFCHAKGVTHDSTDGPVNMWADLMTHICLDWPGLVDLALAKFPIAGCFKRPRTLFGSVNEWVSWHYSGTFYWFRNDVVFSKDWRQIDQNTHGTETWPAKHFKQDEGACLFDQSQEIPYSQRFWELRAKPEYLRWSAAVSSAGVSSIGRFLPAWLEKLAQASRARTGSTGQSTRASASASSQELALYHPYVLKYLRS